ncbi:MAG: cytochrome-c peroxidase [Bacteroidota bacterium]
MKNKLRAIFFFACIAILLFSYKKATLPTDKWPKKVYVINDNSNLKALTLLGKILFYDPVLSLDSSTSCSSCHSPFNAFAHTDHALSHGIDNKIGFRNAPTLVNLAYQPIFMWDGAINHLEMQSLAPITNPNEMNESIEHVVSKLNYQSFYRRLFNNAFNDSIITGTKTLKAIAAFMASIESNSSKYDLAMNGQAEFTEQEKNGLKLFSEHCSNCHTPPLFTNFSFQNNGLMPDSSLKDGGRIRQTKQIIDSLKFKVPTLRNIEFTFPYMHDGRFITLTEVLNFYAGHSNKNSMIAPVLKSAVNLSSNDKVDLIAFLLTLSDRKFLFDKRYAYPKSEIDSLRKLTQ